MEFFVQIRPLASVVRALQQPVELAVTVDIGEAVNEELDEGALRQAGAGQALFNRLLKSGLELRQLICNGSRQGKLGYKSLRMYYSAWL